MKRKRKIPALQDVNQRCAMPSEEAEVLYTDDNEDWTEERRREDGGSERPAKFPSCLEHGFTLAAVNDLISHAEKQAYLQEGSAPINKLETSQKKMVRARQKVAEFFTNRSREARLQDLGPLLVDLLNIFEFDGSRPLSTCSKRSLFPLPAPEDPGDLPGRFSFLQAVIESLNSYHGCATADRPNPVSSRAVKKMAAVVRDSVCLGQSIGEENFDEFFRNRGLDYEGEEVKLAREITWEGIAASLPEEVGKLDIRYFCEGGVLHYIMNFKDFLLPPRLQQVGKTPRTLVSDEEWPKVADGLVRRGLCEVMEEEQLHHVGSKPLLNGLFAVSKQEMQGDTELLRLIMNLKPLNLNTKALEGDTPTLPTVASLGTLFLGEEDVLCISSEDIRCFFYLFRLPAEWYPFLAFGRPVPLPMGRSSSQGKKCYLVARVLPMGYVNSVAIAQHIHRNVVRQCMGSMKAPLGDQHELRRDRVGTSANPVFRVYLDNFDLLQRHDAKTAEVLAGEPSPIVEELRQAYSAWGLPRHPKKSVQQQMVAEVQGALVDGSRGQVCAKPSKIAKYIALALEVIRKMWVTQRELQVVGGGLVYMAMFRRPLLGSLNVLWRFIVSFEGLSSNARQCVPCEVALELVRFVSLSPLAFINLRAAFSPAATASDASSSGGGACISRGLSPYGLAASSAMVRGDVPEDTGLVQVLTVGLFDGLGALRVAADLLHLPVVGHISVERSEESAQGC